jgi:hypothetical protein
MDFHSTQKTESHLASGEHERRVNKDTKKSINRHREATYNRSPSNLKIIGSLLYVQVTLFQHILLLQDNTVPVCKIYRIRQNMLDTILYTVKGQRTN